MEQEAMAQALTRWLGGTMAWVQWSGHDGTGAMALAQAHWHRHGGTASARQQLQGTMAQARFARHDGTITMASARWNGHGAWRDVYFRRVHALSAVLPMNIFFG